MMRMTKITSNENYQRYHIAFSHAIGFTVAVDGTSLSKQLNSRKINGHLKVFSHDNLSLNNTGHG